MITQVIRILNWDILIFYDCTCDDTAIIVDALKDINCPNTFITQAVKNIDSCNLNIGLTYSNSNLQSTVIVVSKVSSKYELYQTINHETFHLINHISKSLDIQNEEELANLAGKISAEMLIFIEDLNKSRFE